MKIKLAKAHSKKSSRSHSKVSRKSHSKRHSRASGRSSSKVHSRSRSKSHSRRSSRTQSKSHSKKYLGNLSSVALEKVFLGHGVHPHLVEHLRASGWFSSLVSGIKKIAPTIIKHAPQIIKTATSAYKGYKENGLQGALSEGIGSLGGEGRPRKIRRKMTMTPARKQHLSKMKKRGQLISKYMKEHGVSLGEASKAVSSQM